MFNYSNELDECEYDVQVGMGGHGSLAQETSSNWHVCDPGHLIPRQGSRHWHNGHPSSSSSNSYGQSIRQSIPAHGFGSADG